MVTLKSRFLVPLKCGFKGVYVIVNTRNKKCYVGSSGNIRSRIYKHMSQLRNNNSPVEEMQKDYNKGDNFVFHVVLKYHETDMDKNKNQNDLLALEGKAIKEYDAVTNGYNKDDCLGRMAYEHDIFYSRIYTSEIIEYINGAEEEPYIKLWSGYIEEHKEMN